MIPWADTAWDEIVPGLWQGGTYHWQNGQIVECKPGNEFDLVISMHPKWDNEPADGVPHWRCRIPDGVLNTDDLDMVKMAVDRVRAAQGEGKKTLVRCQAGYNRSGLVVALALVAMGRTPDEAIELIREKRSKFALCNEHFVDLIRSHSNAFADIWGQKASDPASASEGGA